RAAVGDAHHRVVARFALPVERGVGTVQNVELNRAERALRLDDQAPYAAEARSGGVRLDRLGIGKQQVAVTQRRLLLAEKKLGGAQLQRRSEERRVGNECRAGGAAEP